MRGEPGDAYAAVAEMWRALYDEAPPCDQDADQLLGRLIEAMEPLAYDRFYDPFVRSDSPQRLAAQIQAIETPLPSPARVRALDLALRDMLRTCPVPERLQSLLERLETAPDLQLDGIQS